MFEALGVRVTAPPAGVERCLAEAGIGFAVLLAVISAALPAWRGMRLQVAEALAGR